MKDWLRLEDKETGYWVYRAAKAGIIVCLIALILITYEAAADTRFKIGYTTAQNGAPLIRLISTSNYVLYCQITDAGGYFVDFYLQPGAASQWYYTPQYQWRAICE